MPQTSNRLEERKEGRDGGVRGRGKRQDYSGSAKMDCLVVLLRKETGFFVYMTSTSLKSNGLKLESVLLEHQLMQVM